MLCIPRRVGWLGCLLACVATCCSAQGPSQTLTYAATNDAILNPERGFMRFTILTDPWNYSQIRGTGHSIVYAGVIASDFRNQPLSQSFLNQIQAGFDAARANGIKVKFRFAYNSDGGADAPKSVVLGHIQQLAPLWQANKDVIFHVDAGFIGGWGEWHSSQNGLDTPANRAEILGAILDALPVDRTVGIRTPHFKREIFGGSQSSDTAVITAANAFDGSDLSRVGHLNDCFLSSPSDFGTYINPGGVWPLSRELAYIGGESRFVPMGGETCMLHARNESANAIAEMTTLHTDYLNLDYQTDVINRWKSQGSFAEIDRRLGYRLELDQAKLPSEVKPAGLLPLEFTVDNVGFGELFNPRRVEVVLRHNGTGQVTTTPLGVDPRFWSGGTTSTVATQLALPAGLAEGTYTLALWMPDFESTLRNDVRYAVRFANAGLWEASTGYNVLTSSLVVSATAPGPLLDSPQTFVEITDLGAVGLAGDWNGDRVVDAADYTLWRDGGRSPADYQAWLANFGQSLPSTASLAAVPEPATWSVLVWGLSLAVPACRLGAGCGTLPQ